MLLGLIKPSNGTVHILGQPFDNSSRHLLKHVGAIIERPDLFGYLSAWDNLKLFAKMSGGKIPESRLVEVLNLVKLKGREKDKVKTYSQGMKQRLGIAVSMVHSPELLILDEPTNGLDPQGIAEMRELIRNLSKEHGKTILISSHLLHEIEQIANKMIIIHKGRKMAEGAVEKLLHPDDTLVELTFQPQTLNEDVLIASPWQQFVERKDTGKIIFKMNPQKIPSFNAWLVQHDVAVFGLHARHSLEDYFLSLTADAAATTRTL